MILSECKPIAMRDIFLHQLHEAMGNDPTIFLLSADFGSPVIDIIKNDFPDRFINVGIAEQNLINVAAGLSLEGFKVFCYAIAPFLTMRCLEQIRVNLALLSKVRDMNVSLVGVGAGYSYVVSGPTHQCYEDLSIMRSLPNIRILSPSDEIGAQQCARYCLASKGIKYLRFDAQILPVLSAECELDVGWRRLRCGVDLSLISTGFCCHTAMEIAELLDSRLKLSCEVIDICRLDDDVLLDRAISTETVVSIEEGFAGRGGLDSFVRSKLKPWSSMLGIGVFPDYRFELGARQELHDCVGISAESAFLRIKNWSTENLG